MRTWMLLAAESFLWRFCLVFFFYSFTSLEWLRGGVKATRGKVKFWKWVELTEKKMWEKIFTLKKSWRKFILNGRKNGGFWKTLGKKPKAEKWEENKRSKKIGRKLHKTVGEIPYEKNKGENKVMKSLNKEVNIKKNCERKKISEKICNLQKLR